MEKIAEKIKALAELMLAQTLRRMVADDLGIAARNYRVNIKPGAKYTKIDIGPANNMSGRLMVNNVTGHIFGIKGYGVVHLGKYYGTLDEINQWFWGGYYPVPVTEKNRFLC
jgi:hypothetical protein